MPDRNLFNPVDSAAMGARMPKKKEPVRPNELAALPDLLKKRPIIPPPKKPANNKIPNGFPGPNDPYWKTHPLLTEHKDGTVRQWGEEPTPATNPNLLPKQMLPPAMPVKQNKPTPDLSDKAKGYSSNYYTPNH